MDAPDGPGATPPGYDETLDALHTRFDGRPPRTAMRVAKAGGLAAWARLRDRAIRSRLARDIDTTRAAVAARRRALGEPLDDPWLGRLVGELGALRARAEAELAAAGQSRLCEPSQSGDFAVALQPQNQTVRDASAS